MTLVQYSNIIAYIIEFLGSYHLLMKFGKLEFSMEIIFFVFLVFLMTTTLLSLTTVLQKKARKLLKKKLKLLSRERKTIPVEGA